MSADSKTPSGRSRKSQNLPQDNILKIEVSKYKSIVDALSGERWWRIIFSVFIIGCVLFTGIATIALAIKRMYPYSDITTNGLGATTFKSENSEVSYWLYNTALLWANSGISVEKGDIITIRCSGKFNTAMHHLYKSAKDNTPMQEEWTGPEGEPDNPKDRTGSYYRRKYRIFPGMPTGALVMQVARNNPFDSPEGADQNHQLASADNFYFIGGERENIYINNPGTLYFSINDIVLNERTIKKMVTESIEDHLKEDAEKKKCSPVAVSDFINEHGGDSDHYARDYTDSLFNAYRTAYKYDFDYLDKDRSSMIDVIENNKESFFTSLTREKDFNLKAAVATGLGYENPKTDPLPSRVEDKIRALSFAVSYGQNKDKQKQKEAFEEAFNALIKELRSNRAIGKMRLGITRESDDRVISELQLYMREDYKTAWFDDNVGSFLIVVEKKTK